MDFRSCFRVLLTIIIVDMWPLSSTLDIDTGKSEACNQEKIISAIMENKENKSTAFVFSGRNVWTVDIATGNLLEVERTSKSPVFQKNVTDIIQVALEDRFRYMYYLMGKSEAYIVFIDKYSKPMKVDELLDQWAKNYNFKQITDGVLPTCGAAYLTDTLHSVLVGIFPNGYVYKCPKEYFENGTHSKEPCNQVKKFDNPNNVPASELNYEKCEGLLIDEGDEPWEDPANLTKDQVEAVEESSYRMLFADDKTLRLWIGTGPGNLKYTKTYHDLFGCKSTLFSFIIAGLVIVGIVVIVLGAVGVILVFRKQTRNQLQEDLTQVSQGGQTTRETSTFYKGTQNDTSGTTKTEATAKA